LFVDALNGSRDHHVLGLGVAVYNAGLMSSRQSVGHLRAEIEQFPNRQRRAGQHLAQRHPVDDAGVSRYDARNTIGEHGAILEDLASKNGTVLNGRRIEGPTPLADGAVILVGATTLKFRAFAAPGSTETVAIG